jgi:hypothetical protein
MRGLLSQGFSLLFFTQWFSMTVFLKSVEGGGGVADVNGFIVMKRLRKKKKDNF